MQEPVEVAPEPRGRQRVLAVGGGRGGVGKTLLTANFGIYFAQVGKQVVLVDLDRAGGNVHTCLGVDRPVGEIADDVTRAAGEIADAVVETPIPGLSLVAVVDGRTGAAAVRSEERERLISQVRNLEADYVLLDLGAGTTPEVFDFFLAADAGIVVVVPEPTSVESTYRFLRGAFLRMARRALAEDKGKLRTLRGVARSSTEGIPNPADLCAAVSAVDPEAGTMLRAERDRFRPKLVVNQIRLRSDLDVGDALRTVIGRKMGLMVDYLGHIEHDDAVWLSIRRTRPLLVETPGAKASKNIERICRKILASEGKDRGARPPRPTADATLDYYEVLEVDPGDSEDEIRRAHRRMRSVFEERSIVTYGLYAEDELAAEAARVAEAYEVLIDPSRRREYDRAVFPERRTDETPELLEVLDPAEAASIELRPDTEFTGSLLRRIRQSRGVDLREVTSRTKISHTYLRAIEDEDFGALPALVYTRGFVAELAKYLRLDPAQVSKSYVRRYRRFLETKGQTRT